MITLTTGLPGNGKTLFDIWFINKLAKAETREVYYHGIKDLNPALGWHEFEPEKWFDLPKGAIIVIDEAQGLFGKKPNGAKLPDYYEKLAVHRHSGYDIFIITQHPTLLDNFVRQLVGRHFHAVRKFGLERSTIYEWSAVNAAPQLASSHKNAITLKWAFPKEVYGYYKSAEVHTVKRSFPVKIILAALFIVAVLGVGYYALTSFQDRGKSSKPVVPSGAGNSIGGASAGVLAAGAAAGVARFDPIADAKNFLDRATPRIEGLAYTAPKYDKLTEPTRVAVPAACIQRGLDQCKCFSQQGTAMDVRLEMCINFARNGFFQEFDPDAGRAASVRTDRGVAALSGAPDAPLSPVASQVAVLAADMASTRPGAYAAGGARSDTTGGAERR